MLQWDLESLGKKLRFFTSMALSDIVGFLVLIRFLFVQLLFGQ